MDEKKIARINELAAKKKSEGLSEEELVEQKQLQQEYVNEFKKRTNEQLLNIKVVDEEGNDVTPQKLKEAKNERNKS